MNAAELAFRHRYVPGAGAGAPTLLLLHGTGGTEDDLLQLGHMLLPEAALVSPRGQVLENGMPRFFRRKAEGVFDEDDLRLRAGELAAFVGVATQAYGLDPARVMAVGYSNGANMAAAVLLLHPGALCGAVLFRPMLPLVPERRPDLTGIPVLVLSGRDDPVVAPASTDRLVTLLLDAGAVVTAERVEPGHGLGPQDVITAQGWLQRVLVNEPEGDDVRK